MEQTVDGMSLLKGFAAGLVGGLVATGAKTLAEKVYPPRAPEQTAPPELMAEKLAGPLDDKARAMSGEAVHWVFGAVAGGFYGVLAEIYPKITSKNGATFGLTLMGLAHEGVLPALGLDEQPEDQSVREYSSEATTHMVYGVVTEKVRGVVREFMH